MNMNIHKPCVKCGATERNERGKCKPCARASNAIYRVANLDKVRATKAAWQKANRDKVNATNAKLAAENPEYMRIKEQNRRARKNGSKLSNGLTDKLFALQRGKCACGCKQPLGNDYHMDHIMPLALGGMNTDDNIQLLRGKCNMRKNARHPVDFMQQRGFLI